MSKLHKFEVLFRLEKQNLHGSQTDPNHIEEVLFRLEKQSLHGSQTDPNHIEVRSVQLSLQISECITRLVLVKS